MESVCRSYEGCKVFTRLKRSEVNVKKQEKIDIPTGSLKKILGRMPNWKSLGPDLVRGFWLKNFSST